MALCNVHFMPLDKSAGVEQGTGLLEAAGLAGITLNNLCGGDGVCGRCRMIVRAGEVKGDSRAIIGDEESDRGVVLSCISTVESDLEIEIPATTHAGDRIRVNKDAARFSADSPGLTRREFARGALTARDYLQLESPSLESNFADLERINLQLKDRYPNAPIDAGLDVLRKLPCILRENNFKITAVTGRRNGRRELMGVEGGDTAANNFMAVVDVGTTTVVAHLVNTADLSTVSTQACFNSQSEHGREVTSRIISAEKKGVDKLQELVVQDINRLITDMTAEAGIDKECISGLICAGNTTMMHFLLGLTPDNIRREPFIAAVSGPAPITAAEIGIEINPQGLLYIVPGIGSWVGGDLTAGILAVGLHENDEITMLIDVGTNGEVIIGGSDWMMACSASTGPALEGASVACGMMGETGAIERVFLKDGAVSFSVIGDAEPKGICGSGIIDLVAVLLEKGTIDRSGRFVEGSEPGLEMTDGRGTYRIPDTKVFLTQDDLDNIITAKAAVFAATKIMLDRLDLSFDDVSKLYIAGGFGNFIDIGNAVSIGLLPGLPLDKIEYAGNTSLWGAKFAALSSEAYDELYRITDMTTYYDLMGSNDYVEQFQQAQFLPHTDMGLFKGK